MTPTTPHTDISQLAAHIDLTTVSNLNVFGGSIDLTVHEDGTVTATPRDDADIRRAFASLQGDGLVIWHDYACRGIEEAFTAQPVTHEQGAAAVLGAVLDADALAVSMRASAHNNYALNPWVAAILLTHPEEAVRRAALANTSRALDTPTGRHLAATSTDEGILAALTNLGPQYATIIAERDDTEVRMIVASVCTDPKVLDVLSQDPAVKVRRTVAQNRHINDETLLRLAQDPNRRQVVAAVKARDDARTGAAAHLLFTPTAVELTKAATDSFRSCWEKDRPGVVHHGRAYMFVTQFPGASSVFHLCAEDPDGVVAKRFTYGWGRGVKRPIDGRWAATTVCERPWNTAVPDSGHAPWTMDRPCRSCISRLASHHVTGDVASFL